MRKVRKKATEFPSQKPADPPERTPVDSPPPEEPGEPSAPPGAYRGFLLALLVWAIAFLFLFGVLIYEGLVDLIKMARNALGL
jgi:hypothetical protein